VSSKAKRILAESGVSDSRVTLLDKATWSVSESFQLDVCSGPKSQRAFPLRRVPSGRVEAVAADDATPSRHHLRSGIPATVTRRPNGLFSVGSRASVRISLPRRDVQVGKRKPNARKRSNPDMNARVEVGCRSW